MSSVKSWLKYHKVLHGHRKWGTSEVLIWDQARSGYVLEKEKEIFSWLKGREDGATLEVACGTSRFSSLFSKENYVGLDFNDVMLKVAKIRCPNRQYVKADGFNLPFRNNVFRIVFAARFVHHYGRRVRQFFSEAKRVSDGTILFDISKKNSLYSLVMTVFGAKAYARTVSDVKNEIDGLGLAVSKNRNFFFLPSLVYSLIPILLSKIIDGTFAKAFPSRCFVRIEASGEPKWKTEKP